jgi:hypothetical protein
MAGVGAAGYAAQKLATIGKSVQINIGPALVLGGGGVLLSGKW